MATIDLALAIEGVRYQESGRLAKLGEKIESERSLRRTARTRRRTPLSSTFHTSSVMWVRISFLHSCAKSTRAEASHWR